MKKTVLYILFIVLFILNLEAKAENVKITDADTISIDGEKIRFSGIDAPEMKQTCIQNDDGVFWLVSCGVLARDVLVKKIGNEIPKCIREPEKDFFGRTLAECFVNGESLSKFLVINGYAFDYKKYSKKKYANDELFAKENKLGLWNMDFQYPFKYRKNIKTCGKSYC